MNSMTAFSVRNPASMQSSLGTLPLPLVGIPNNNQNDLFDPQHHPNISPLKNAEKVIINSTSRFQIDLTEEEEDLFNLLRTVTVDRGMKSKLRVAGGWVRDKILASNEFQREHRINDSEDEAQKQKKQSQSATANSKEEDLDLTFQAIVKASTAFSNYNTQRSLSVTEHVDIDITLDDCYGSEFATEINTWLSEHPDKHLGEYSVGCIIENPEQTQHLETATMRLNNYWIDFVNLRAEEYSSHPTSDSRIPSVMRIGTPMEDAERRDLTINSLYYNINTGEIEDMTGRGLYDLQKGVVDTPLTPLKTLLDDPLRVLRSVRFAARLRFDISESLWEAASDPSVNAALGRKVSRERIGTEVNSMLKSRDPARALILLTELGLINTIFPKPTMKKGQEPHSNYYRGVYKEGLSLLSTTHDHLVDCMTNRPGWCQAKRALESGAVNGLGKEETLPLMEDEEARRLLWYAAFLKPLRDRTMAAADNKDEEENTRKKSRKSKEKSAIQKLLVDDLKRPTKESQSIESIMKAADEFTELISNGESESALAILLSGARVVVNKKERVGVKEGEDRSMEKRIICSMDNRPVNPSTENDPVWENAMEFRQRSAKVLKKVGNLWRAAFILSLCEQLMDWQSHQMDLDSEDHLCEGDSPNQESLEVVVCGILKKYDVFAAAMLQMGLIGIWKQKPILDGGEIKGSDSILPNLPNGPEFRTIMDSQLQWMVTHPGGSKEALVEHLRGEFPSYV